MEPAETSTSIKELALAPTHGTAPRGEILAWAMYDVANSTYAAVVCTAVYNAYFVNVIVGKSPAGEQDHGTFLLTVAICLSSLLIVVTAPIIGTICDATASKKKILFVSTFICVIATACMALAGPGAIWQAMLLFCLANLAFGTGEDLIASFLPELASVQQMGRISAIGWAAGYIGSIINLGGCLAYVSYAQSRGMVQAQFVPVTLLLCAAFFAVAVIPTFLFLKERAVPDPEARRHNPAVVGFQRLKATVTHATHYRDLFNFLVTLFLYSCGTTTVIHLASVYAQVVLGFTAADSILMILVVSLTAAIGACVFGWAQDKFGSVRTLKVTLTIWTVAIACAIFAQTKAHLWLAANLVGIAMGATGSVGRAVVGQFAPEGRSGEFLGLWGMSVKLATGVGAITFGLITEATHNNYRVALAATWVFFILGILMLSRVDERRGRLAARTDIEDKLTNLSFNGEEP